ncbi:hypothetical protein J8273_7633 [Carpediemonas membranifera]|uniref:Uncharacterized protein n=1 Tax=Carpediemonas membranifera TaxID=201153 RepID=A0A8J6AZZ7_9EUKA|nr:hypothetical protein J8273_7633 [Carpediemonas membranifera]|eukprot:KAG9391309.1 hypothetical protein J8273_7633 [Carpediemonas membranifera]
MERMNERMVLLEQSFEAQKDEEHGTLMERIKVLEETVNTQAERIESLESEMSEINEEVDAALGPPEGIDAKATVTERVAHCEKAIKGIVDMFSMPSRERPQSSVVRPRSTRSTRQSAEPGATIADANTPRRVTSAIERDSRHSTRPQSAADGGSAVHTRPPSAAAAFMRDVPKLLPPDLPEQMIKFVRMCSTQERRAAVDRIHTLHSHSREDLSKAPIPPSPHRSVSPGRLDTVPAPLAPEDRTDGAMMSRTATPGPYAELPYGYDANEDADVPLEDEMVDALAELEAEISELRAEQLTIQDVANWMATRERSRSPSPTPLTEAQLTGRRSARPPTSRAMSARPGTAGAFAMRINQVEFDQETQQDRIQQCFEDITRLERMIDSIQEDTGIVHEYLAQYQMIEDKLRSNTKYEVSRVEMRLDSIEETFGLKDLPEPTVTAKEFAKFQEDVAVQFETVQVAYEGIDKINGNVVQIQSDVGQLTSHTATLQSILRKKIDKSTYDADVVSLQADIKAISTAISQLSKAGVVTKDAGGRGAGVTSRVDPALEMRLAQLESGKVGKIDLDRMIQNMVRREDMAVKVDRSYVDNILDQITDQLGITLDKLHAETEAVRKDTLLMMKIDLAQKADKKSVNLIRRRLDEGAVGEAGPVSGDIVVTQLAPSARCLACGRPLPRIPKFSFTPPKALTPKPVPSTLLHTAVSEAQNEELGLKRPVSPVQGTRAEMTPTPAPKNRETPTGMRAPGGSYVNPADAASPFQIRSISRQGNAPPATPASVASGRGQLAPLKDKADTTIEPKNSRPSSANGTPMPARWEGTPRGEMTVTIRSVALRDK